jgi:surface antigen
LIDPARTVARFDGGTLDGDTLVWDSSLTVCMFHYDRRGKFLPVCTKIEGRSSLTLRHCVITLPMVGWRLCSKCSTLARCLSTKVYEALELAARYGHVAVVERLLQDVRVDPSASNNDAVQKAAQNGQLRDVRDVRVDPSANDNYAVRLAALYGHLAVVERLLQDERVDPSASTNYAVRWAATSGHLAVVERLLRDDASIRRPTTTTPCDGLLFGANSRSSIGYCKTCASSC